MSSDTNVLAGIHFSHAIEPAVDNRHAEDRKTKRRVRFPKDDELISDYLEPFRPVSGSCTSQELIEAYVSSCYQNKVAPIDFVLEQLRGIDLSICNERYSRLSLRGIRFYRSHVETLEEIFRQVHFRELDLEETFLDDESATALFDMLLHYETCNDLRISLNLEGSQPSQAWHRCVAFLRKSIALNRFTLTNTRLSIGNFIGVSYYGLCLEQLSLIDCNITGQVLVGLVLWLQHLLCCSALSPIRSIHKGSSHKYNGPGSTNRLRSLPSSASSSRLTGPNRSRFGNSYFPFPIRPNQFPVWELKLCLSHNRINSADAENLLPLVRHQILAPKLFGPTLTQDSVSVENPENSSSDSTDQDTTSSSSNSKSNSKLGNRSLSPVGGIGYISELDLSHNSLGDDGLRILANGLLQSYRNRLRRLHSESTTISSGHEVNHESTTSPTNSNPSGSDSNTGPENFVLHGLKRLNLADNHLTASGMQALAIVLMQTPESLTTLVGGLISLDLSHNINIRDEGVEILCEGLIRNHSLKELYIQSIRMSFTGMFALSGFLCESKCLQILDIRGNELDLASLMALSKTLIINRTLTSLLSDCRQLLKSSVDSKEAELFQSIIESIESSLKRNRTHTQTSNNSAKIQNENRLLTGSANGNSTKALVPLSPSEPSLVSTSPIIFNSLDSNTDVTNLLEQSNSVPPIKPFYSTDWSESNLTNVDKTAILRDQSPDSASNHTSQQNGSDTSYSLDSLPIAQHSIRNPYLNLSIDVMTSNNKFVNQFEDLALDKPMKIPMTDSFDAFDDSKYPTLEFQTSDQDTDSCRFDETPNWVNGSVNPESMQDYSSLTEQILADPSSNEHFAHSQSELGRSTTTIKSDYLGTDSVSNTDQYEIRLENKHQSVGDAAIFQSEDSNLHDVVQQPETAIGNRNKDLMLTNLVQMDYDQLVPNTESGDQISNQTAISKIGLQSEDSADFNPNSNCDSLINETVSKPLSDEISGVSSLPDLTVIAEPKQYDTRPTNDQQSHAILNNELFLSSGYIPTSDSVDPNNPNDLSCNSAEKSTSLSYPTEPYSNSTIEQMEMPDSKSEIDKLTNDAHFNPMATNILSSPMEFNGSSHADHNDHANNFASKLLEPIEKTFKVIDMLGLNVEPHDSMRSSTCIGGVQSTFEVNSEDSGIEFTSMESNENDHFQLSLSSEPPSEKSSDPVKSEDRKSEEQSSLIKNVTPYFEIPNLWGDDSNEDAFAKSSGQFLAQPGKQESVPSDESTPTADQTDAFIKSDSQEDRAGYETRHPKFLFAISDIESPYRADDEELVCSKRDTKECENHNYQPEKMTPYFEMPNLWGDDSNEDAFAKSSRQPLAQLGKQECVPSEKATPTITKDQTNMFTKLESQKDYTGDETTNPKPLFGMPDMEPSCRISDEDLMSGSRDTEVHGDRSLGVQTPPDGDLSTIASLDYTSGACVSEVDKIDCTTTLDHQTDESVDHSAVPTNKAVRPRKSKQGDSTRKSQSRSDGSAGVSKCKRKKPRNPPPKENTK